MARGDGKIFSSLHQGRMPNGSTDIYPAATIEKEQPESQQKNQSETASLDHIPLLIKGVSIKKLEVF